MPLRNLTLLHLNDLQAHYFPVPITSELIPRILQIGLLTAEELPNYIKRYEAYRNRPFVREKDSSPLFELGGYAYIASYLKQVREESPNVIVFDAGDTIQGHPLSTITRGEADYRILNRMIDVGTLGNHEFYFGGDQTLRNLDICRYPLVSANVVFADSNEPICGQAYLIKEVGGIKVGIIGVTGLQKNLTTHQTSDGRSMIIREPLPFVRKYVDWLKGKVDVLVLLSHAGGVAIDEKIAESNPVWGEVMVI